jgi:hypothetical protein
MGIETTEKPDHVLKQSNSASPSTASRWREFISRGATLLTVAAGLLSAAVAFWAFVSYEQFKILTQREQVEVLHVHTPEDVNDAIADLNAKITSHQQQLSDLTNHINSISNVPTDSALNLQLQQLSTSVADISSRLSKLESVILENPVKALEIPLMKRDIENIKDSEKEGFKRLKENIDRTYDISKWLLVDWPSAL